VRRNAALFFPPNKLLKTTGNVGSDHIVRYRASNATAPNVHSSPAEFIGDVRAVVEQSPPWSPGMGHAKKQRALLVRVEASRHAYRFRHLLDGDSTPNLACPDVPLRVSGQDTRRRGPDRPFVSSAEAGICHEGQSRRSVSRTAFSAQPSRSAVNCKSKVEVEATGSPFTTFSSHVQVEQFNAALKQRT
jgi:hypothetical protein